MILSIWVKHLMVTYFVRQKGFYPHEYMSDFEKFKEQLPGKEMFYSLLIGKKFSNKEYQHVANVWNILKDWKKENERLSQHDFEKFRKNSLKNYGLCPSHYLNAPALIWDSELNISLNLFQIQTRICPLKKV